MQNANMRTNWFLLGDIHGQAAPIEYFYKFNNERLNLDTFQNNLILLGDVGCNFSIIGKGDEYCKQSLSRFPFTYICLRGKGDRCCKAVSRQMGAEGEVWRYHICGEGISEN